MDSKMLWQQFMNTGNISAYLDYRSAKNFEETQVSKLADKDRGVGDPRNEYWGSGSFDNPFN